MFKISTQSEIGKYISKLVATKFSSQRAFCKAWLAQENIEENNDEIRKKANKLSQIKKGNKGIQIKDLPVFCTLLDTSCEEILSAGHTFKPNENRLTNYLVAFSNDQKLWEEYIHHVDNLILNADEYGNTVLDYAIRFKNLRFIEYLINKKYIWFDSKNDKDFSYSFGFGAGTNISRQNHIHHYDFYLQPQLSDVIFRGKLIALAIENNNLNILKELKAREIPDYYNTLFYSPGYKLMCENLHSHNIPNEKHIEKIYEYYNQDVMDNIINASDEIIDYYTNIITITENKIKYKDGVTREYEYMYFYISQLLDALIEHKHNFTEFALRRAIKYSLNTYELVKEQMQKNIDCVGNFITEKMFDDSFDCNFEQNIVRVRAYNYNDSGYKPVIRNLILVKSKSNDIKINYLIKELNELYNKIVHIESEFVRDY